MNTAFVHIWGEQVGAIAWNDSTGYSTFEYNSDFKKKGWDLAPFQMPITTNKNRFSFPALRKSFDPTLDTFKGLPGLLADSLPDRYGNDLINIWLARQGRPSNSMNPVETLCFIGSRGIGALEFIPAIELAGLETFRVEMDSLVELARHMLTKKEGFTTNLKSGEEKAILEILRIGTSAGGARPKAVIAFNEKTMEVRSGQTSAPEGFEHWLLKLDGVSDVQLGATQGYGRVEMAYYNMATSCGIDMMPSRLLVENGRAHFMTKRFDREEGDVKHHVQSFCALKHFDYNLVTSFSYEQLFQTLRELNLPYSDTEQMFRRMVFNVMARNCDDHTKNFGFRLKEGGDWELAPAYDICHAYKPGHQWVSRHALSINGKRSDITIEDILKFGDHLKLKNTKEIIEQVSETVQNWNSFADEVEVSPALRDEIRSTLLILV